MNHPTVHALLLHDMQVFTYSFILFRRCSEDFHLNQTASIVMSNDGSSNSFLQRHKTRDKGSNRAFIFRISQSVKVISVVRVAAAIANKHTLLALLLCVCECGALGKVIDGERQRQIFSAWFRSKYHKFKYRAYETRHTQK